MPGATSGGVAYVAHSSGYVFGILVAAAMLLLKVMPTDKLDLIHLMRNSSRRWQYRSMVSKGYNPFKGAMAGPSESNKWVDTKKVESTTPDNESARELQLRREISQSIASHDLRGAAARYMELLTLDPETVLSRQQQLDVANQLMSSEEYTAATVAYEKFLKHYANYQYIADIYLMLGLLYGRYLNNDKLAEDYLQRAIASLTDPRKLELAKGDLRSLQERTK